MRSIEAKPTLPDTGKPKPVDLQLLMAVNNNDLEGIMIKLGEGANIEAFDVYGYNALQNALSNDNNEIACFLIEQGADVNARTTFWRNTSSYCQ